MDTDFAGANNAFSLSTRKDNDSSFLVPVKETFLDPRFWQALGRALGWHASCELSISCRQGNEEACRCRGYYWMYKSVATPKRGASDSGPTRGWCC